MEKWRNVVGYEGFYEVSDLGRVRSVKFNGRILRGSPKLKGGYIEVCLRKNGHPRFLLVHRLVLEAFVGPCPDGCEACHNDGSSTNNYVHNLRWDTHSENIKDIIKHGTRNVVNRRKVLRSDGKVFDSLSDAGDSVGTHASSVSKVCRGIYKQCKGYGWEYV